ncbi:gluconate 5-dehydrogenase [Anoxynatronum buryatiense]|uniref:Gluconate 5-dehydrogenase n=2 Tax=Anoxynatronum buryatiense TaxID=489973 RepID=A0AA45WWC2_9CLOT|nr:gluconate 5-dehydrogenase [Anoxynatronum buryatiense]
MKKMESSYPHIFSLAGKTAVISGGATGLGLAMTECMVSAGAKVIMLGRSLPETAQAICDQYPGSVFYRQYDVVNTQEAPLLAAELIEAHGQVDILINNAGNHCKKPVEEMTVEDFEGVMKVHVTGAFALSKAFVPHMRQRGSGSILFTASMTSFIGQPYVMGYAAAKSAYLGLVRTLASEVSGDGIRVNAIAPGWIDTPMFRKATDNDPARKAKILGRTPMNKVGEPADIGWAAVYLCSDAAKFITGICLPVDGGALIGF